MIRRTLTTTILVLTVGLALISPTWITLLVVIFVVGVSLLEFYALVEKKGIIISKKFGLTLGCLIPFGVYLINVLSRLTIESWEIVFIILVCFVIFVVQFTRRDSQQAIAVLSTTVFGMLYISWPLSFLIKLKFLPQGEWLIFYLLLVTKLGDIGAYMIGTKFGRHTLIRRISPNKSKEGTAGGLVFSILASIYVGLWWLKFELLHSLILGIILGSLAQLGDLCESLLKRDCQLKDSGSIFPGLGGMLDLVDSIIFATPIFYLYIKIFL